MRIILEIGSEQFRLFYLFLLVDQVISLSG